MLLFLSSALFIVCSADGPRIVYSIIYSSFKEGLKCLRRRLQPVAKMLRHSHKKATFLASNRSWSYI